MIRVVLDTNVLVSSILFGGTLGDIPDGWKNRLCTPLFSQASFAEFRSVLTYPKFSLTPEEIESIIVDEVLPFCEVVEGVEEIHGVCRDPDDDKFLACAATVEADCIVTGDRDLLDLGTFKNVPIITVSEFVTKLMACAAKK
ncbi:MAG: putative toxin-antitoxin system toxin component, PIN family [Syntrophales bacterium]|jgi:putative PIN family toxin of toxin-antitoxin system|nr:putative toxin-antitoxin system toxin component, PIN family [Syntrophales bacterium]MDY0045044.1 putative toxin-antitoxin system toxin component, PIN family [Syntrophales bacterium]